MGKYLKDWVLQYYRFAPPGGILSCVRLFGQEKQSDPYVYFGALLCSFVKAKKQQNGRGSWSGASQQARKNQRNTASVLLFIQISFSVMKKIPCKFCRSINWLIMILQSVYSRFVILVVDWSLFIPWSLRRTWQLTCKVWGEFKISRTCKLENSFWISHFLTV